MTTKVILKETKEKKKAGRPKCLTNEQRIENEAKRKAYLKNYHQENKEKLRQTKLNAVQRYRKKIRDELLYLRSIVKKTECFEITI